MVLDVGIKGEKIEDLGPEEVSKLLDVKGEFASLRLVDLHGHWYEGSIYGIDAQSAIVTE